MLTVCTCVCAWEGGVSVCVCVCGGVSHYVFRQHNSYNGCNEMLTVLCVVGPGKGGGSIGVPHQPVLCNTKNTIAVQGASFRHSKESHFIVQ